MIKILGASALLAIAVTTPASAQILGGGGGLGGSLGGTLGGLGGQMGGPGTLGSTFDRSSRDLPIAGDATGSLHGSTRSERNVDTRKGHVKASNDSSLDSAVANSARIGDRATSGTASGSASGSGSADAQLIGTDAVRSAAGNAVNGTRSTAGAAATNVREMAGGAVGRARAGTETTLSRVRSAAPNPNNVAVGTAHTASDAVAASTGTLALAGSAAASGTGAFPVSPGMAVTDAKGRPIGTVQSVRTSGTGAVQQVLVRVKDKTATLPAANFTGSGDALVSAMGRSEVRESAD